MAALRAAPAAELLRGPPAPPPRPRGQPAPTARARAEPAAPSAAPGAAPARALPAVGLAALALGARWARRAPRGAQGRQCARAVRGAVSATGIPIVTSGGFSVTTTTTTVVDETGTEVTTTVVKKRPAWAAAGAPGGLLVVCGPSGVGKSTLIKKLMGEDEFRGSLNFSISHTTREPRQGETDGVEYHFVKREDMERMIKDGEFLEHANVHGNLYGTSMAAIDAARADGRICVLDVDLAGVKSMREQLSAGGRLADCKARFVLIRPEGGVSDLESRLRARGTESEESVQRRLDTARRELVGYSQCEWDQEVVNVQGDLEPGAAVLRTAIRDVARAAAAAARARAQVAPAAGSRGQRPAVAARGSRPWASRAPRQAAAGAQAQSPPLAAAALLGVKEPALEVAAPAGKSVFEEMSALARELGPSCVDLGQGFPNFDPPDFVVQALRDELDEEVLDGMHSIRHQYTRTAGHPAFVEAIAERYSSHFGRTIDPMEEVAISVGATGGLYLGLQAALDRAGPGAREIVALEPFFELYRAQARGLGAALRTVPLCYDPEDRSFALDAEALRGAVGPQTAALIVNTPQNPTGKTFTEEELLAIADVVRDNPHVTVISDEVYKFMIYDPPGGAALEPDRPSGHTHFANLPGMWERTLTVSSAGKTFGITGWQIGWIVGPKEYLGPIHKFMPNLQFCAPTLMQRALSRVLEQAKNPYQGESSYYQWLRKDYRRRREVLIPALEGVGVATVKSQGGFFLLGDITKLCGRDGPLGESWDASVRPDEPRDWAFSRALAAQLGIVSLPVSPFFGPQASAENRTRFARFCFAKTLPTLEEAGRRLRSLRVS